MRADSIPNDIFENYKDVEARAVCIFGDIRNRIKIKSTSHTAKITLLKRRRQSPFLV